MQFAEAVEPNDGARDPQTVRHGYGRRIAVCILRHKLIKALLDCHLNTAGDV